MRGTFTAGLGRPYMHPKCFTLFAANGGCILRTSDEFLICYWPQAAPPRPAQLRSCAGTHVFLGKMVSRWSLPSNALIGGGEDTCLEFPQDSVRPAPARPELMGDSKEKKLTRLRELLECKAQKLRNNKP